MSEGRLASFVSSRISGKPVSTVEARSIHTRVASQVEIAEAMARSSGQPQQDAPTRSVIVFPVDVLQRELAGQRGDRPGAPAQIHGTQLAGGTLAGSGEPDLISARRPRETFERLPAIREPADLPGEIDDRDRAPVVAQNGMVQERDAPPVV